MFKTFNFNKFNHILDVKAFFQDSFILSCGCERSHFIEQDHQHVGTCDFRTIKMINRERYSTRAVNVEKIIYKKGLIQASWRVSVIVLTHGVVNNKQGIDKSILTEWKYKVISKVDEKKTVQQYIW